MIGSLLRIGIAALSSCDMLFSRPAMANDWPSRSSTSVSARRVSQRRDAEALEGDAVVEVERADFGLHLQADHVAGDRRLEGQPDAELLELDRDRVRSCPGRPGSGTRRRRGSSPPGRCRRSGSARRGSGSSPSARAPSGRAPMPSRLSKKNRFRKSLNTVPAGCRRRRSPAPANCCVVDPAGEVAARARRA